MDAEEAFLDFRKRRENYSKVYEPVDDILDGRVPHIKIINSRQFIGMFIFIYVYVMMIESFLRDASMYNVNSYIIYFQFFHFISMYS